MKQRAPERQTLLDATRELAREALLPPAQARHLQRPAPALGEALASQTVAAAEELEVLRHGQIIVEREALGHVADARLDAAPLAEHVVTEHPPPARGRREQAAQHPNGRRLAGPVRSQKPEHVPPAHREGHAVDGDEVAEGAGEPFQDDGRRALRAWRRKRWRLPGNRGPGGGVADEGDEHVLHTERHPPQGRGQGLTGFAARSQGGCHVEPARDEKA